MITRDQAIELVLKRINQPNPAWPDQPEFVITRIEDHAKGWLICYDSRPHHETGDFRHAIAGNAPFLVSAEDGSLFVTGTAPPFQERLKEAEARLESHLRAHRDAPDK